MARKHDPDFLTSVELEFMNGLWTIGSGTVREIMANMDAVVDRAYTSGATVMRILEQKGFVSSDKKERALVYTPQLSKNEYHCHLNYRYVACWRHEKNTITIEVYYVGSREQAPD